MSITFLSHPIHLPDFSMFDREYLGKDVYKRQVMRRTIGFGSVSAIISGHQYAGDGCAENSYED